ncbi:hypothetical protein LBMAG42_20390 [Deltaproteobacteria bacterium]|nr:hypothetical protein LBMAG42_20390 [Deltaproteobacteria bacterium]
MELWSDRTRVRNGLVALGGLMLLGGWYAKLAMGLEIGWRQYTADPARYDGHQLTFPLWVVTGVPDADHYLISKVVKDVPVEGPSVGLHVGDTVSVIGDFSKEKWAVVQRVIEVHTLRRWKEALGVAGLLAWAVAMPLLFAWRGGRLEERGGG